MSRVKVLIVDDEYLIRELLQEKIDWDKLNCEVVLKASCASEVYDYIDEEEVDLILTDINMPYIDGLEMAKKIRRDYPKIRFIVITGYNEFEYAKKGIEIGVEGFILKPIDQKEVEPVIEKAVKAIKEVLNKEIEHKRLVQRINDEKPFLKEKFFFDIIEHGMSKERINDNAAHYGINKNSAKYQVAIIEILNHQDIYMTLQQCRILLEDYFKTLEVQSDSEGLTSDDLVLESESVLDRAALTNIHVFVDSDQYLYVLSTLEHMNIFDELNYGRKVIKESLDIDIRIGISKIKESLYGLTEAAREAKVCLKYYGIDNQTDILSYDEISILNDDNIELSNDEFYINELLESLQFFIKAGLVDEVEETIDKLFVSYGLFVFRKKLVGDVFLKVQLAKVVSSVQYTTIAMASGIHEELEHDVRYKELGDSTKLLEIESMAKAREWIKEFCAITVEHVNKKLHMKNENVIDSINTYIEEHINDSSLSLKGTASLFYMNSSYLSRIYKKQVGESFKERVFKLRMEKAVEILKTTNMKVYEVGNQVGIDDPNYFSLCFKRYMNMSISEFRKKMN